MAICYKSNINSYK